MGTAPSEPRIRCAAVQSPFSPSRTLLRRSSACIGGYPVRILTSEFWFLNSGLSGLSDYTASIVVGGLAVTLYVTLTTPGTSSVIRFASFSSVS